ncbi:phosphotransferase enzyme family protein [Desmospora profundinema]|uniref:Ser/Thr protein kinase RdoA (MazF antagonist) n=1 Tax=Desmospora profundinema TaxID=1571184 RepID=A0ABU1IHB8_9BACL|nr:phosphotransferase [Desmospora profundinema]MDR6224172.1 Ser/Thr protein kinase RdoA (MazF antagonist) [Desmospora profundinema]
MIDKPTLFAAAERFGLDPESLKPLGGFHQNVFLASRPEPARVLKFSPAELPSSQKRELSWIQHLRARGLSVARPVRSLNGEWIETIDAGETSFTVVSMEKVAGSPPDIRQEWECGSDLFTQWGAFLGAIHRETRRFRPPTGLSDFPHFDEQRGWSTLTPDREDPLYFRWKEALKTLQAWPRSASEYGLVHGDFHSRNFHWHDGKITAFDFGDGERHWYLYDLAVTVYHALDVFPREDRDRRNALARDLWEGLRTGYTTEHPGPVLSEERLCILLDYRRIFSHLYLRIHLDRQRLTPKQIRFLDQQRQEILAGTPVWEPHSPIEKK